MNLCSVRYKLLQYETLLFVNYHADVTGFHGILFTGKFSELLPLEYSLQFSLQMPVFCFCNLVCVQSTFFFLRRNLLPLLLLLVCLHSTMDGCFFCLILDCLLIISAFKKNVFQFSLRSNLDLTEEQLCVIKHSK